MLHQDSTLDPLISSSILLSLYMVQCSWTAWYTIISPNFLVRKFFGTYSSRRVAGESSETLRKLCVSTNFHTRKLREISVFLAVIWFITHYISWSRIQVLVTKVSNIIALLHCLKPVKCQCCPRIETSHLTGFYMRATLVLNGLGGYSPPISVEFEIAYEITDLDQLLS